MKYILALSLLLGAITGFPALSQTPQTTVETKIAVIETEIKNLNEKVANKFENLQKNLDGRFASLEKKFERLSNTIIACIGIPLTIIAINAAVWIILAGRRSRKDQTFEKQIEILTQEIEALKRQQIVRP